MELIHSQLKEAIDQFLRHVNDTMGKEAKEENYKQIADDIFTLHHFAQQLVNSAPEEETLLYNGQIILDSLTEKLSVSERPEAEFSLIDAAEATKSEQYTLLASVFSAWKDDMALYEVFFEDFAQISHELAA